MLNHTPLYLISLLLLSFLKITSAQEPLLRCDSRVYSTQKPFKAARMGAEVDLWEYYEHDCGGVEDSKRFSHLTLHAQANLKAMMRGGVRLSIQQISELEMPFLQSDFVKREKVQKQLSCLIGFPITNTSIFKENYFASLVEELLLLKAKERETFRIMGRDFHFQLLREAADLEKLRTNEDYLGMLVALEGGHLLGDYSYIKAEAQQSKEYEQLVLMNVDRLKGSQALLENTDIYLDFPIFSMSFGNAFEDGFCGKVQSMSAELQKAIAPQTSINAGFTSLGQKVVKRLLRKDTGRRILIDVTDMPVAARKWYYEELRNRRYHGDTIPILSTGMGVFGDSWKESLYQQADKADKSAGQVFNCKSNALAKEDLQHIIDSKGLIGIPLQPKRLAGGLALKELEAAARGSAEERDLSVKLLALNLCRIIQRLQDRDAWSHICLSSMFDSGGSSFHHYKTSEDWLSLQKDLRDFFSNPSELFGVYKKEEIKAFMYDYDADTLIRKLFQDNLIRFLENYLEPNESSLSQAED